MAARRGQKARVKKEKGQAGGKKAQVGVKKEKAGDKKRQAGGRKKGQVGGKKGQPQQPVRRSARNQQKNTTTEQLPSAQNQQKQPTIEQFFTRRGTKKNVRTELAVLVTEPMNVETETDAVLVRSHEVDIEQEPEEGNVTSALARQAQVVASRKAAAKEKSAGKKVRKTPTSEPTPGTSTQAKVEVATAPAPKPGTSNSTSTVLVVPNNVLHHATLLEGWMYYGLDTELDFDDNNELISLKNKFSHQLKQRCSQIIVVDADNSKSPVDIPGKILVFTVYKLEIKRRMMKRLPVGSTTITKNPGEWTLFQFQILNKDLSKDMGLTPDIMGRACGIVFSTPLIPCKTRGGNPTLDPLLRVDSCTGMELVTVEG